MSDELELAKLETLTASLNARAKRERLLAIAREAARLDPTARRLAALGLIRLAVTPDVVSSPKGPVLHFPEPLPGIAQEILGAIYRDPAGAEYWNNSLDYASPDDWADVLGVHSAEEKAPTIGAGFSAKDAEILRINLHGAQVAKWRSILAGFDGATLRAKVEEIREHREKRSFLPESLCATIWPAKPESVAAPPDNVANVSTAEVLDFLRDVASREKTKRILRDEVLKHFESRHVTDVVFRQAYQGLSPDLKRVRGETNKTRAALKKSA
jgi:hypothetical protein